MAKLNLEDFVFLLRAATPPAATAPAAPQMLRMATVSQKARQLLLTKAKRTEAVVVHQQIFMRIVAKPGAIAATPPAGVTVSAIPCAWTVETYLQRNICFYSITGLLGCTEDMTKPLTAVERGQSDLPAGMACEVGVQPIAAAEARVIASLDRTKDQVLDEDYRLAVKPQLTGTGAVVTER